MNSATEFVQKMLVAEKANALRVLEVLEGYPEPKIYSPGCTPEAGVCEISFVWGSSIYLSFTGDRIKCLFYFDHQEETHDNIKPEGLVRILDEWKAGGSL